MEHLYCPSPFLSLFAFPVDAITLLSLLLCGYLAHRYYASSKMVRVLSGVPAAVAVISLITLLLIVEGVYAVKIHLTWPFLFITLLLMFMLLLVTLRHIRPLTFRNGVFLLNHAGFFIVISSVFFGAPDRVKCKMVARLNEPVSIAYDLDNKQMLSLPFAVVLDKLEIKNNNRDGIPGAGMCRSTVVLTGNGKKKRAEIEVNAPVAFNGFQLYQNGTGPAKKGEPEYTMLLAVKDPWLAGVYAGIGCMLLGAAGLIVMGNGSTYRTNKRCNAGTVAGIRKRRYSIKNEGGEER